MSASHVDPSEHLAPVRGVRPSTPDDEPAIIALMSNAGLHPHAHPQYLNWKYWQPRGDWVGARSYVLTDGSELLAHVGVVPSSCVSRAGRLRIASMVDWAARPDQVGAGVRVMKHVASLTDALLAIGGSQAARKLMPLMGYRAQCPVTAFVRPLFPLKLLRRATVPGWKRLPRFARSLLWTLSAPTPPVGTWCARRLTGDDALGIESILAGSRRGAGAFERSAAQLRYMLDCPITQIRLYAAEEKGRTRGYFMLAFAPGQARLIDAGMSSEDSKDWRALIQCAVAEARRAGNVAEFTAWASDPQLSRWLAESGFHRRFNIPVWLRAGRAHGFSPEALRTQMLDSDAAYLHGDTGELWA